MGLGRADGVTVDVVLYERFELLLCCFFRLASGVEDGIVDTATDDDNARRCKSNRCHSTDTDYGQCHIQQINPFHRLLCTCERMLALLASGRERWLARAAA